MDTPTPEEIVIILKAIQDKNNAQDSI